MISIVCLRNFVIPNKFVHQTCGVRFRFEFRSGSVIDANLRQRGTSKRKKVIWRLESTNDMSRAKMSLNGFMAYDCNHFSEMNSIIVWLVFFSGHHFRMDYIELIVCWDVSGANEAINIMVNCLFLLTQLENHSFIGMFFRVLYTRNIIMA